MDECKTTGIAGNTDSDDHAPQRHSSVTSCRTRKCCSTLSVSLSIHPADFTPASASPLAAAAWRDRHRAARFSSLRFTFSIARTICTARRRQWHQVRVGACTAGQ